VLKIIIHNDIHAKGSPRAVVKLLPCDHEVMGSSENSLLQKCRERLDLNDVHAAVKTEDG
jgi:hypothetical protein